ncbi:MAG TPA: peptidylprolyl isomerase [Candidatus Aquicultor sp.]|jgi:peptidyl-prolyl cis-trans isomerase B (cyclophilin B)
MKRIGHSFIVLIITALAALLTVSGCGSLKQLGSGGDSGTKKARSTTTVAVQDATNYTRDTLAQQNGQDALQPAEQPPQTAVPNKQIFAVIETNRGKIVIQLFPHKAPKTVDSVVKLINSGFYNGIKWHRIEPGFVAQTGDPLSKNNDPNDDGLGNPGYTIKLELNDVPHLRGTVGMAHNAKDVNSGGSQFYICLNDESQLDGKYTVIGKVTEGMDVVDKIQYYDVMNKVYIIEKPLVDTRK